MRNKYLLVNLHTSNHGDEAAAKAFLSKSDFTQGDLSIIFNSNSKEGIPNFDIDFKNSLLSETLTKIDKILIILSFYLPLSLLKLIYTKKLRSEFELINNSDVIVSMPGGANLGLYKDWRYLWRIALATRLNKKTAIYSISFGPFENNLFYKLTKKYLKKVNFLSLRDAQSYRIADEMKLNYIKSIDTAFLTQPSIECFNLKDYDIDFLENEYIVFVPNKLTSWHPTFRNYSENKLKDFYKNILEKLIENKLNIIFLPQLFGGGNDKSYFEEIKLIVNEKYYNNIVIVDEKYSSDIQQNIIKKSKFVIGARYHSIIFSINNNKPFISLSYENKMNNMLEILDLQKYSFDLTKMPVNNLENEYLLGIERLVKSLKSEKHIISNKKAFKMANDCYLKFNAFIKRF